jgi:hypothetical protein
MHQRHAACLAGKFQRPIQRRIAAAENQQTFIGELRCALHLVMDVLAFESIRTFDTQAARLKRTEAAGDDHGACVKACVERSAQQEGAVLQRFQFDHFLTHMKLRIERLGLLQQPVDQFLRTAHGQRRDVINRLLRI